jgi:tetratricopeptide (TPR) repeat protein
MRSPRALFLGAVVAFVLSTSEGARAQGRAELEKARAAYIARNYAEAEERLRALVDPSTGTKERVVLSQARMVLGAALLAEGKREPAEDIFEKLILEDPAFEPDPLGFPGDVINTFIDTRVQLQERLKAAAQTAAKLEAERRAREESDRRAREAWLDKVKAQAGEERVTVRNERLVALMPFGAGQFQNRQPALGWTFLGLESGLFVATAVTWGMGLYWRDRARAEARQIGVVESTDALKARADDLRTWNLGLGGALATVAAIGIVQANVAFVPQFDELKKRSLPPLARATPRLSPFVVPLVGEAGGGVLVGATGVTF